MDWGQFRDGLVPRSDRTNREEGRRRLLAIGLRRHFSVFRVRHQRI